MYICVDVFVFEYCMCMQVYAKVNMPFLFVLHIFVFSLQFAHYPFVYV